MLRRSELAQLEWSYRTGKALSVYVGDTSPVRASRTTWRRDLDHTIAEVRDMLRDAQANERAGFDRCVQRMHESLDEYQGTLPARGWVGFFPEEGVAHTESLPVPLETVIRWGDGICVAPYIRVLKQHRPAVVALVDHAVARIHHYAFGVLDELETLHAHVHLDPQGNVGTSAGELRAATAAMLRDLADRLVTLAGARGWILLGGMDECVNDLTSLLPPTVERRVHRLGAVDVHAAPETVAEVTERGVTQARREADAVLVAEVLERHAAGGHGIAGYAPTLEALREHAVDTLFFTGTFLKAHPGSAELLVRGALEQDIRPEYISGTAAQQLDAMGGVGASLRFVPIRVHPTADDAVYRPSGVGREVPTIVR